MDIGRKRRPGPDLTRFQSIKSIGRCRDFDNGHCFPLYWRNEKFLKIFLKARQQFPAGGLELSYFLFLRLEIQCRGYDASKIRINQQSSHMRFGTTTTAVNVQKMMRSSFDMRYWCGLFTCIIQRQKSTHARLKTTAPKISQKMIRSSFDISVILAVL